MDSFNHLPILLPLIRTAGEMIRSSFHTRNNLVFLKESNPADLVTETDRKVENFIIESLKLAFPKHKFIGEETTAQTQTKEPFTEEPTWCIDPIDGTTNFVHGNSIWHLDFLSSLQKLNNSWNWINLFVSCTTL